MTIVGYGYKLADELLDQPVITGGYGLSFLLGQPMALVFLDLLLPLLICFLDNH
jgi:hypothetical protein